MKFEEWAKKHCGEDNWCIVTGGSSGIGFEYVRAFSSLGLNVLVVSNEIQKMEENKAFLKQEFGNNIENIFCDFSDRNQVLNLSKKIREKSILVLVNNAGIGAKGHFESNPIQTYLDIVNINAMAPTILTYALLPDMKKKACGFIIHVGSVNAFAPIPGNQVYTASKAYLLSFASALGRENKNTGVKFQILLPGTTDTPFHPRQGVQLPKGAMLPSKVVSYSLKEIDRAIAIPNLKYRLLSKIMQIIPRNWAMDIASFLVKRNLDI